MRLLASFRVAGVALALVAGCDSDPAAVEPQDARPVVDGGVEIDAAVAEDWGAPRPDAPAHEGVYSLANGCYAVEGYDGREVRQLAAAGELFAFSATEAGARFALRASDLGTYLLYDAEQRYFVADGGEGDGWRFSRPAQLASDVLLVDDGFRSPAEWVVAPSPRDADRFRLQHKASGQFLAFEGLVADEADAAVIAFLPQNDCAVFPEMGLDAVGEPRATPWPDGDLFGIAEVHSHLTTNMGFGGSGMFHGAPFHPLGVEHALSDCSHVHGDEGRRDLIALFYDGARDFDIASLLPVILAGESDTFNHFTDGWPTFTDWPNAWRRSTHQVMYYRWLERAWRGGLRLVVQHATGNSILCEFMSGVGAQSLRYTCNDMVSVDRSIESIRAMERYIDAQWGGPGKGWFRVVETSAEARAVIAEGKLAVVLGIEISNLFDCFLTPPEGFERCTPETLIEKLDHYHALGVRVVFPVHKFDNGFAPGDGAGGVIELGNFVNSGHYTSQAEDCPLGRQGFDGGSLSFGDLNRPRDDFEAPPVVDISGFAENPVAALRGQIPALAAGGREGHFCQTATMTALGEQLFAEMMKRGMIPDIAHLPQHATVRALELLEAADYPALSTHGNTHGDTLFDREGVTGLGIRGCADPEVSASMVGPIVRRAAARAEHGAHPGTALAFDLNGFAGQRRPRFGENSRCEDQANPVEYPFSGYDGAVEFLPPHLGERPVDFNTEGFLHIGLLPELIEDLRRDGATDADLEPLFRSAESVVRMWARAEAWAERE